MEINKEELAEKWLDLIPYVINKWYGGAVKFYYDDMFSEGLIGLTLAINNWDESKGVEFKTFAVTVINNQISKYFQLLNYDKRKVNKIENMVYYDQPTGDDENGVLLDALDSTVEEDIDMAIQMKRVKELIQELPEKERIIIESYYIKEKTLTDLGSELGMTAQGVSFNHLKALKRLKEMCEKEGIELW